MYKMNKMNCRTSRYFFIFFIIIIIFFIIFYTNIFTKFYFNKKEGMIDGIGIVSGQMVGQIKRTMNPVSMNSVKRNVRKTITNTFSNPTVNYYTNKLNQIFG